MHASTSSPSSRNLKMDQRKSCCLLSHFCSLQHLDYRLDMQALDASFMHLCACLCVWGGPIHIIHIMNTLNCEPKAPIIQSQER